MMTEEKKQALIADMQSEKLVLEKWRDDWNARDKLNYQAIDIALAALTQPASPALKLPDEMVTSGVNGGLYHNEGWNACLAEVKRLNAPHTAPIEPICATGGAEWVKVPREPTRQMMSQGHFAMAGTDRGKFRRIYQAMIAAAPQPE